MVRPNTRRSYAHYLDLLKTTDTRAITHLLDAMTPRVRNQALLTYKTFFKWCLRRDYLERSPVENSNSPKYPSGFDCSQMKNYGSFTARSEWLIPFIQVRLYQGCSTLLTL